MLLVLMLAGTAGGFIHKLYSLREVLNESTHVLVGRLEKVDPRARTVVAGMHQALKGKLEFSKILMNIALGPAHHAEYIIERMSPGAPVIVFYKRQGNNIASLVHAGDIWFQLFAADQPARRNKVWWRMSHVEIYMGRTYNGATPKLIELVGDVLGGRVQPPEPNPKVPRLDPDSTAKPARPAVAKGKTGGFHRQLQFRHDGGTEIRGISWADVNGDERLDVLLCRQRGNVLLVNQPGGFRLSASGFVPLAGSRSAGWADYDGDDHPDLLTDDFRLFTNAGASFRNDSRLLPAASPRNTEGAGWIDYNADGRPDVIVTNGQQGVRLYENTGKKPGWFRDVSDKAGLGANGLGAGNGDFIVCFDYDNDGRTDFFYNLGGGVLAHNQGDGTFKLDKSSGLKLAGPGYKRGLAVADFDNDGDLDLFVPGKHKAQLFRNEDGGSFTDVFARAGDLIKEDHPSFAAAWADVNCDGYLDLFVCHTTGSSRLYLGDGKGKFTDISEAAGVRALSPAYAAGFADVDADGDLDLVVNLADRIVVAFNELPRPPRCAPLSVRVHVRKGLIGAVVRVLDERRRLRGLRELCRAEGCGGQSCPVAHFGLRAGNYQLSVCLSDGRVARKPIALGAKPAAVVFHESEFK